MCKALQKSVIQIVIIKERHLHCGKFEKNKEKQRAATSSPLPIVTPNSECIAFPFLFFSYYCYMYAHVEIDKYNSPSSFSGLFFLVCVIRQKAAFKMSLGFCCVCRKVEGLLL